MTALVVFGMGYAAFAALAASMARHREQVAGRALAPRALLGLRLGGWSLLALALAPAVAAWGASVGVAGWLGVLTFAALGVGLQLAYAPRAVVWSAPLAGIVAAMTGLVGSLAH